MTVIASEVERFDRLSATWWNRDGPMRPLHVTNALRLKYISGLMARHFRLTSAHALDGLTVLDVGCGGGLLAEPLAARGACVLGIDASPGNVASARLHAERSGAEVKYRIGEPVTALAAAERFDVVLALEVVEHVSDVQAFVTAAAGHVAPGGLLVASTIDRTWKSWLFAIVGAEYVFRVLPRGTHEWRRFVRPTELAAAMGQAGFAVTELRGMRYLPVLHRASWTRDTSVNYIAAFARRAACRRAVRADDKHRAGCGVALDPQHTARVELEPVPAPAAVPLNVAALGGSGLCARRLQPRRDPTRSASQQDRRPPHAGG